MQKLQFLNTKEIKEIKKKILEQWGCDFKTEFAFVLSSKNKVYLISRDIEKIDFEKLPVSNAGVYFGEIETNGELRLSIEGSQMIGDSAKKNFVKLSKEQMRTWLKGNDLEIEMSETAIRNISNSDRGKKAVSEHAQEPHASGVSPVVLDTKEKGFVILKYENDFLGTGKVKENKILNFVPKTRRILAED